MHTNLEQRVGRKGRWGAARNIAAAVLITYASFKAGQYREANTHTIDDRRMVKQITEAVVDEGYAWRQGADHRFFQYAPVLVKDTAKGVMWGEFEHDGKYTGRVQANGKVGDTFGEEVEEYTQRNWERVKEGSKNAWNRFRDWTREKMDYLRRDRQEE